MSLVEPWNIVDLMERPLPAVPCWMEPSVLPKGGKFLFGGFAKVGKSFLMLDLARALAQGKRPFNSPHLTVPTPVKVLVIEMEIGAWGLQKRATTMFAGENLDLLRQNFRGISKEMTKGIKIDSVGGTKLIAEWCHKVGAQVLFLDPIGKMHTYDENDAGQIARLFTKLDEILEYCRELDLSIVLSHHFKKPSFDPKVILDDEQLFSPYNFRGSTKWYDDPDTLVTVNRFFPPGEPPQNPRDRWWFLKTRWETRQGGDIPEWQHFSFNRRRDSRIFAETPESFDAGLQGYGPSRGQQNKPAPVKFDKPFRL